MDVACYGAIEDDQAIFQGFANQHISALGVIYRTFPRVTSVLYTDDVLL